MLLSITNICFTPLVIESLRLSLKKIDTKNVILDVMSSKIADELQILQNKKYISYAIINDPNMDDALEVTQLSTDTYHHRSSVITNNDTFTTLISFLIKPNSACLFATNVIGIQTLDPLKLSKFTREFTIIRVGTDNAVLYGDIFITSPDINSGSGDVCILTTGDKCLVKVKGPINTSMNWVGDIVPVSVY